MKLHILPIEPLTERYSAQWILWFDAYLKLFPYIDYQIYDPVNYVKTKVSYEIKQGQFLDIIGTNRYKNDQLNLVLKAIERKEIQPNDVFLLHDGWYPGIEMLAYVRDCLNIPIKIVAMMHAGSYDPNDFLHQKKVDRWGKDLENAWFQIYDKILVATNYHKELLVNTRTVDQSKIHVVFFPMYTDWVRSGDKNKKLVLFPHRLAPEKQPEVFELLAARANSSDLEFEMTKLAKDKSKEAYWQRLGEATFAVSTALQETWGIAMIEAVLSGCIPIVPSRLSYKELYPPIFCYGDCGINSHSVELILQRIEDITIKLKDPQSTIHTQLHDLKTRFTVLGALSIPVILNHCYTV